MNIEEILEGLEDMLEEAWSLPLSGGKCVVDVERIRQYLQDIRLNIPSEIKQAKLIVTDRNDIIQQAEKQSEAILRKAEEKARMMIAHEEVVKQAQEKAAEILHQAQSAAKEIRHASHEFSDSMLKQSEDALAQALKSVQIGRAHV